MGKFSGKKLLVLGSNVSAVDIIEYAKSEGALTIAADFYPPERSAAKRIADENVLISTADIDALDSLIKERKIDGVLSGISEFNLLNAMELSRRNNLPFYCSRDQWERIESKELFRQLCIECNVPCPATYFTGREIPDSLWETLKYPLVMKPVDACTSAGVFICHSEAELRLHYKESLEKSNKGIIIIEEFIEGNEFTAHYAICGGKAALACIDNRYPVAIHEGDVTTIPVARIYPSVFAEDYIESVNASVVRLCEKTGVQDGILFIQGIHNPDNGDFRIFEAGLRCAGEAPYRFLKSINNQNFIHIIVDHALLGYSDYDITKETPMLEGKCCGIVSYVAKHGTVGKITGLEETVGAIDGILEYENRYPVGSETPDTDTLRQLMIRFVMSCDSRQLMAESIDKINRNINVFNTENEDMVVKFDPARLFGEF
ncbi:MAG: ATP-grasp domain-containing protein [Ruminococcus sp.]|nr:ATP-grasp domain-containing protein [Ruminococcus sp.]